MIERNDSSESNQQLMEKLEIFVSARNLADLDTFTTTDSFLIVLLEQPGQKKKQILKSKVYDNDLNPNYAETVVIDFHFEIRQNLTFEIYHQADPPVLVGFLQTTLGAVFGSPTNGLIKKIVNQNNEETGKIVLRCEKIVQKKKKTFETQISGENLPSFTWWWFFGGTFPFFRVFRKRENDQLLVYESQVAQNTTNPDWKPFSISERKLSKNDDRAEIEVRFYNYSNRGNHALIGSTFFSLAQLRQRSKLDIKKQGSKVGAIRFNKVKRRVQHLFGAFIQNGLQLALVTCIDFTASNGSVSSPTSLHYSTVYKKSQYENAMEQVLNILMDYDYDKLVPCYGFGAQVSHPNYNTYTRVSHCFPLNGNRENPDLFGKEAIVKAYRDVFKYIKLSGPTKFEELLKQSMEACRQFQTNPYKSQYMILFILTDGEIHDKQEVIDLLIQCNKLPLSIIIVGIGNGDFSIMHELDDDDCQMVDSHGNKTERDLVQFVQFKKFKNNGVELAREVLFELPRQVSEYYELMGVHPEDLKRRPSDVEEQKMLREQYPLL